MVQPAPILAAEDEETDATLLQLAIKKAGLANPLVVARDGQEAVEYLSDAEGFSGNGTHPMPGLLLLDIKMPRMNGFDVLAWLHCRPEFKRLPVVVLSSSCQDSDLQRARSLGARDYLVKPTGFTDLVQIIQQLYSRWLSEEPVPA